VAGETKIASPNSNLNESEMTPLVNINTNSRKIQPVNETDTINVNPEIGNLIAPSDGPADKSNDK